MAAPMLVQELQRIQLCEEKASKSKAQLMAMKRVVGLKKAITGSPNLRILR